MFSLVASAGFNMGARAPVTQGRVAQPKMYDISAKWDPESPRDYDNFNPFERNDEGQMCDSNGCFPGQDGGYRPPNRPDVSWAIQQENNKRMDELKTQAKFNLKGKPGNWVKGWAATLGAPP